MKNTNKILTAGLVLLLALFVLCAGALKIIPSNIFGYKGSKEEFKSNMERISEDVIEEVSDDFYNKTLDIFKNLATAIDASVVISSDFDRTDPNTTGTVVLRSNTDSSALVYIFGQPAPAAGVNLPVVITCSVLAVVAVLAVAFFIARKRSEKSNACA